MRLFVALNFDDEVKTYLREVQNQIRAIAYKGNYTSSDNFHLTLRFLGEFREGEVANLYTILDKVSEKFTPFEIKIGKINSFLRNNKHLVFIEVIENSEAIVHLAHYLNKLIDESYKLPNKFHFRPHITIAREIIYHQENNIKVLPFHKPILVNNISLMLSKRNKQNKLIYTPLHTITFTK